MAPDPKRAAVGHRTARWGVDWWIHRVAISELYRAPPPAVVAWGLPMVLACHAVLDEVERARADAAKER